MKQLRKTLLVLTLVICLAFVTAGFALPMNLMQANAMSIMIEDDKEPQDAPAAPTLFGKTATSITLNTIEDAEYSIDGVTWQEETEFTGLAPNTGYTFFARIKETSTHFESPVSIASEVFTTNKAEGTFVGIAPLSTTYTTTLRLSNVLLPAEYTWVDFGVSLSAGNGQVFEATYTDPSGDFHPASGLITVHVAKADGVFVGIAPISIVFSSGLRLSDLSLPTGYVWVSGSTLLGAGNGQAFAATYTDPSGNFNSASGDITINVTKAGIDTSGVVFASKTVTFDGNEHSLVATNLPAGVTVESYDNNNKSAVGVYTITVNFSVTDEVNFNVPSSMTATLTIVVAQDPVITTQPQGDTVSESMLGHTLSVTATSPDNGTLSFQWYINTVASNTGGKVITGATSSTFVASRGIVGTDYYYVVVTNTNTANNESISVTSDVIALTISPIGINNNNNNNYKPSPRYIMIHPVVIIACVVLFAVIFLLLYVLFAGRKESST